jgi:hypothetical protein
MASSVADLNQQVVSRRSFLRGALCSAGGLALYAGEFERHWLEVVKKDIGLRGLSAEFDGLTIAQLSDIHLDEFTEPFLLREAIDAINQAKPDMVLLTGDYVSAQVLPQKLTVDAVWQCSKLLSSLQCKQRYAVFGNHDIFAGEEHVGEALKYHGMTVLRNAYVPIERGASRIWLSGLDDPCEGQPDADLAIPARIRNQANEPVILMCHAPDYVDQLRMHPAGQAVSLVLSGHTPWRPDTVARHRPFVASARRTQIRSGTVPLGNNATLREPWHRQRGSSLSLQLPPRNHRLHAPLRLNALEAS